MMTFSKLLQNRRAIRDFQAKDVPLETIKEIIQESTLAPSASNGQPCQFIIINNKQTMKKLSDESKKNLLQDFAENKALLTSNYEAILKNENFNVFYNAPCVIYVVGAKSVHSLDVDCALAASYIMFSTAQRGLGTCWVNLGAYIRDPKIKAEIGIPDNCRIIAPIIIGYPKVIPAPSERNAPNILKIIN
jgi:nitroreductase